MVNILANVGVMLMAVYFYMRTSTGWHEQAGGNKSDIINSFLLEVLVGIILMSFSIVVDGLRYDFRFLLFCFSAKYLDWKVTSSSILLLAILRFGWGNDQVAQMNVLASVILAVSLPLIAAFIKKKWNDLMQLYILVSYCMWPTILLSNYLIADRLQAVYISMVMVVVGYGSVFIMHHFVFDLYYLIISASTDHLTGLKNVRAFHKELSSVEQRNNPSVTLAVIDIDYFKDYNDCFGHDSGDATLRQLAGVFNAQAVSEATFYRIGGEEFALVLENTQATDSENFVRHIQRTVEENVFFATTGEPIALTISAGVAHRRKNESLKKTLKRADNALYQAKRNGRNKVMIAQLH
jgi:diguanylate cyclase